MARPAVRVLNRGGRPTRAEAERRQEHLIETAGAMFMKFGFDGTSIDAVAEAACMSKRTVYARYRDKNELFSAVLRNLIDRWFVPINQFQLGTRELEPMLMEIGRHLLTGALAPQVVVGAPARVRAACQRRGAPAGNSSHSRRVEASRLKVARE